MRFALSLALLAAAPAAWASEPFQVDTDMLVERPVTATDGTTRTQAVKPGRVVPGDRVTMVVRYRNTGGQPLSGVVLSNPVPAGMAFRGPAPGSPTPEVSVDGETFAPLAALRVRTPAGAPRIAVAGDVVAVRWRLPNAVAAGSAGQLAFLAVVK